MLPIDCLETIDYLRKHRGKNPFNLKRFSRRAYAHIYNDNAGMKACQWCYDYWFENCRQPIIE